MKAGGAPHGDRPLCLAGTVAWTWDAAALAAAVVTMPEGVIIPVAACRIGL
jgi:hypothetical protein